MSPSEVGLALTVLRALVDGLDVSSSAVARWTGSCEESVERFLEGWPASEVDETGTVLAFWGISRKHTPHKIIIDGRALFGWCAWDSLALPALLDTDARIESTCPVTSTKIRLEVVGAGVRGAEPPGAVISLVDAGCADGGEQVYQSFCQHVHFLAAFDVAREWLADRNQAGYVLPLDQAWELARRMVRLLPDKCLDRPKRGPPERGP